ncbi:unnamed protein product [Caenorhabditis brenneri]
MLFSVLIILVVFVNGGWMRVNIGSNNPGATLLRELQAAQLKQRAAQMLEAEREKQEVHLQSVDKLEENGEVLIEGIIRGRVDIDLKCQGGSNCIPLHISVRPSEQAFVYNAMYMNGVYDLLRLFLFILALLLTLQQMCPPLFCALRPLKANLDPRDPPLSSESVQHLDWPIVPQGVVYLQNVGGLPASSIRVPPAL